MVLELTDFSDIKPILHENTTQLKIQASHWFPSSNQREKSIITGPFEKEKKSFEILHTGHCFALNPQRMCTIFERVVCV